MSERPFTEHSFQQFLAEHKLMGSRCNDCGALHVPPRPHCPACHGDDLQWHQVSGEGRVVAFTAIHVGPNAMVAEGYNSKNPYLSGIVVLDEGPKVSAQLMGIDATNPSIEAIGTPVTAWFIDRGEGEAARTYLAFQA